MFQSHYFSEGKTCQPNSFFSIRPKNFRPHCYSLPIQISTVENALDASSAYECVGSDNVGRDVCFTAAKNKQDKLHLKMMRDTMEPNHLNIF